MSDTDRHDFMRATLPAVKLYTASLFLLSIGLVVVCILGGCPDAR